MKKTRHRLRTTYLLILLLFSIGSLHAQNYEEGFIPRCGEEINEGPYENEDYTPLSEQEHFKTFLKKVNELDLTEYRNGNIINIPVVFHIVHQGQPIGVGSNISQVQIQSQLDVLNEDFRKLNADVSTVIPMFQYLAADVEVQFCLASTDPYGNATSGVTRHAYNMFTWTPFTFDTNVKPNTFWNPNQYLNFWVADLFPNLLGYATFPWDLIQNQNPFTGPQYDGIVVDWRATGRTPQNPYGNLTMNRYDKGRTGTHEVGHWLGLWHPWQGGCGNPFQQCNMSGDNICDTPPKVLNAVGCNINPNPMPNACGAISMDQNFMDYADDACAVLFTQGQKTMMRSVLNSYRSSILTSPGCPAPCTTAQNLRQTARTNNSITMTWNAVAGATSYNLQYRLFAGGPWQWTQVNTVANTYTVNGLTAFTPYEFRVQTVCNNGFNSNWSGSIVVRTLTNQYACGYDPYEIGPLGPFFLPFMQSGVPAFGLICPAGDIDWQLIQVNQPNTTIQVVLDQLPADYDLELRDQQGNILAGSYNPGLMNETVTVTGLNPGIYSPFIFSNVGMFNPGLYFRVTATITVVPPTPGARQTKYVSSSSDEILVYPNPAKDQVQLEFNLESAAKTTIQILDINGSACELIEVDGDMGRNFETISLANYPSGIYIMQLRNENIELNKRLIIQ